MHARFIEIGEDNLFLVVGKHWINVTSIDFIKRTGSATTIGTTGQEIDLEGEEIPALNELLDQYENKEGWR